MTRVANVMRAGPKVLLGFALALGCATTAEAQVSTPNVDLELILAVDSSSSVNDQEFDLQMRGIAEAFEEPAVFHAIQAAGDLGVAVMLMQWSDSRRQFIAVDWMHLRTPEDMQEMAEAVHAAPRFLVGGGTAVGGAIEFAVRQFERNDYLGRRRVIDISGDGRTNQGPRPDRVRDLAVQRGIVINGLAILNEDQTVASHFADSVIGGTGSFVMTANDYEDFSAAIIEKLLKEIAGAPVAMIPALPLPQEARR